MVAESKWIACLRREASLIGIGLLAVTIVVALFAIFPLAVGEAIPVPPGATPPGSDAVASATHERLPRQVAWTISAVALTTFMVIGSALALLAAWRTYRSSWSRLLAMLGLGAAAAALYFGFAAEIPAYLPLVYGWLGPQDGQLAGLFEAAHVLGSLGPAYVLVALVGMGYASRLPDEDDPGELRDRIRLVRAILFTASAAMVAGTMATLYRLELQIDPVLFTTAGTVEQATVDLAARLRLARALSVGYGATYSLFLIAACLPPAVVLGTAVDRLSRAKNAGENAETRQAWVEREGLALSLPSQAFSILATLAPFLAAALEGPVADLVRSISM